MKIDKFSKHIFWNYNKGADLPDNIVIEQVSTYGEISDLITLAEIYNKKKLIQVLQSLRNKSTKRVNFILKVIL